MDGFAGTQKQPVRGTQTFVGTMSKCWRRPSLLALEVAWRWTLGAPAAALVGYELLKALREATAGTLDPGAVGLDKALLNDPVAALSADPVGAAGKFVRAIELVRPGIMHFAVWLVPLLMVGWVVQSSVGRTMVLRRVDPAMKVRVGTLMGLQAIRLVVLAGVFWLWFAVVGWAARTAVTGPIADGAEPNLVLFCGLVIVTTLGLYTGWGLVSWVFGVAPLVAMQEDTGVIASLRRAFGLRAARGKLMEINLVLGIVKIMGIVLAMVFSATPLPFQSVETQAFLVWWWCGVGVLYLLWSDFFHVARLVGYLDLKDS